MQFIAVYICMTSNQDVEMLVTNSPSQDPLLLDNQIPLRDIIPGFKLFSRKCVFGPRDQYTDYIPDEYRVSNRFIGDGC